MVIRMRRYRYDRGVKRLRLFYYRFAPHAVFVLKRNILFNDVTTRFIILSKCHRRYLRTCFEDNLLRCSRKCNRKSSPIRPIIQICRRNPKIAKAVSVNKDII